ncbi:MAG: haloalkane dehalogenase [Pseudomonadales bacterium]
MLPITPDNPAVGKNKAAWENLKQWTKPMLTAFSDSDPIMAGGDKIFQKLVPGTEGQDHTTIVNAGHFLQEDQGEDLANVVATFIAANS